MFDLQRDVLRMGGGQVDLVDDQDDLHIGFDGHVGIGDGLGLDALGYGTIHEGAPAHLTLFRTLDEPQTLEDALGETLEAERHFETAGVVVDGVHFPRTEAL